MAPDPQDRKAGARWAPAFRALGDERLTRLAQGGSDAAFAAIYGRYAPVLHGYCRSILHDEEEAGDALQNAMLKALTALRRSGPAGPLRPWLFRIAHNEAITLLRQRARRPGELPEERASAGDTTIRHAVAREDLATLLVDLERLTEHQRGALVMRELGGLSYDDVATALETSPLAARQAVFAARRKLTAPAPSFGALLPAAPLSAGAVLALAGGTGGGAAATGGALSLLSGAGTKALAGVLATATVGVGSVELAHERPARGGERRAQVTAADAAAARPATRARVDGTGNGAGEDEAPAAGQASDGATRTVALGGADEADERRAASDRGGTSGVRGGRTGDGARGDGGRGRGSRADGGRGAGGRPGRGGGTSGGGGSRGPGTSGEGGSWGGESSGGRGTSGGGGSGGRGTSGGGTSGRGGTWNGGMSGGGTAGGGSGGGAFGNGTRPAGGAGPGGGDTATVPVTWSPTGRAATAPRPDCPQPTATAGPAAIATPAAVEPETAD